MGRVEAICISLRKGEKKSPQPWARFVAGHGIEGDAHAGPWHRQVSLLAAEDIEAVRERRLPGLKSGDFAENVVVTGVELCSLGLGSRLRLGSETELTMTQLGKVCHHHCEIYYQTGDCIMPRLGIFARVARGGTVGAGDAVEVLHAVPRKKPQAVVLAISPRDETPASAMTGWLEDDLQAHIYAAESIPDDRDRLAARLRHYSNGHSIDFVLVVGGSGPVPRDVILSAGGAPIQRPPSGLVAAPGARPPGSSFQDLAVVRNGTFILAAPGSDSGALEHLRACVPELKRRLAEGRSAA